MVSQHICFSSLNGRHLVRDATRETTTRNSVRVYAINWRRNVVLFILDLAIVVMSNSYFSLAEEFFIVERTLCNCWQPDIESIALSTNSQC